MPARSSDKKAQKCHGNGNGSRNTHNQPHQPHTLRKQDFGLAAKNEDFYVCAGPLSRARYCPCPRPSLTPAPLPRPPSKSVSTIRHSRVGPAARWDGEAGERGSRCLCLAHRSSCMPSSSPVRASHCSSNTSERNFNGFSCSTTRRARCCDLMFACSHSDAVSSESVCAGASASLLAPLPRPLPRCGHHRRLPWPAILRPVRWRSDPGIGNAKQR
jgi:hypothetical protein